MRSEEFLRVEETEPMNIKEITFQARRQYIVQVKDNAVGESSSFQKGLVGQHG